MLCRLFSGGGEWGYAPVVGLSFSLRRVLLLQSVGSGPQQLMHGLGCPTACGILPDWGLSLCLLHWQVNSLPLSTREPQTLLCYQLLYVTCRRAPCTERTAHHSLVLSAPHSLHAALSSASHLCTASMQRCPLLATCGFSASTTLFLFHVCSFGFCCFCFFKIPHV